MEEQQGGSNDRLGAVTELKNKENVPLVAPPERIIPGTCRLVRKGATAVKTVVSLWNISQDYNSNHETQSHCCIVQFNKALFLSEEPFYPPRDP